MRIRVSRGAAVVAGSFCVVSFQLACGRSESASFPAGSLVVAEARVVARPSHSGYSLEDRYPAGSQVVLAGTPSREGEVRRILSMGLLSAGEPAVSPDGRRIVFSGKTAVGPWQVYEAFPVGGEPTRLTSEPGGACSPALLPDGTLVAVSPVPVAGEGWVPAHPSALLAFAPGTAARRLTFGVASIADPTVLGDGRILFVSAQPGTSPPRSALFAVNNDGTGVSAYACQHDGDSAIRRPRELYDGRIVFVSQDGGSPGGGGRAEAVLSARPWKSRGPAWPDPSLTVRSVEPFPGGEPLLVVSRSGTWSVERADAPGRPVTSGSAAGGFAPVEAVPLEPRPRMPLGRLSTVDPKKTTGILVCLNARRSDIAGPEAERVRIVTTSGKAAGTGGSRALGEVPLASDGSFLVEVPADVPLGIEALDASGKVLRSLSPSIWVRPGETRGCIGCHEPHGTAPRNRRPLAAKSAPVRVGPAVAPGVAEAAPRPGAAR